MTAQASDRLRFGDRFWSIAAIDGSDLFDPADVGIRTEPSSSANWAGFLCVYAVADGRFVLDELALSSLSTVEGRRIAAGDQLLGGTLQAAENEWNDDLALRGLGRPVGFSGRILAGDGFLDELYEHMGFHPAWKFEEVRELHVEQGRVVSDTDRSQRLAEVREQILAEQRGQGNPRIGRDQADWIEQSFSLGWRRSLPNE